MAIHCQTLHVWRTGGQAYLDKQKGYCETI